MERGHQQGEDHVTKDVQDELEHGFHGSGAGLRTTSGDIRPGPLRRLVAPTRPDPYPPAMLLVAIALAVAPQEFVDPQGTGSPTVATLQESATPFAADAGPDASDREWLPLDGVVAQAGDAIVTRSQLDRYAQRLLDRVGQDPRSLSDEERAELFGTSIYREMLTNLEVQAGQDLGLAAADVDRLVRAAQRDQRLDKGAGNFSDLLRDDGLDAIDWEQSQRRLFYRRAWQDHVLGKAGFGAPRPRREAFVRPGKLFAIYRSESEALARPEQIQFQEILVPVQNDDPEGTLLEMERLREDLMSGRVEYDLVASQLNRPEVAERKGLSELLPAKALLDPMIREFAIGAELGEISEVLPIEVRRDENSEPELRFFRLLKLVQRLEGEPAPPYSDANLQDRLRDRIGEIDAERLLDGNQRRLFDRSYRWVREDMPTPLAPPPGR